MCFLNPIWCEHSAADRKKHQSQIRRWVFYRNVDEAAANANRVSEHALPSAAAGLEDFIPDNNNYNGISGVAVASPVFMSILTYSDYYCKLYCAVLWWLGGINPKRINGSQSFLSTNV